MRLLARKYGAVDYIGASTMPYSAKTVANYFLSKSFETGVELSPMKLIKLVYLAHGWSLGLRGEPLIEDAVQAWKYGPVIPTLYREFKGFGNTPITALVNGLRPSSNQELDTDSKLLLDKIWDNYSKLSATQLSALTHESGSPWYNIWNDQKGSEEMGAIIPNALIKRFYKNKVDASARR